MQKKTAPEGGLRKTDHQLGGVLIGSEDIAQTLHQIQTRSITRRCAISAAMAAILAPHIFGEGAR